MKELKVINRSNNIKCIYRFIEKKIYLKANNMQYANGLMQKIISLGGKIKHGRNWLECDIFGDNTLIKLGNNTLIDTEKMDNPEIEGILYDFFREKLIQANFEIENEKST